MIDRQLDQENEESPSIKLAKLREAEIEKKKAEELEILKKPRPDLRTVEAEEKRLKAEEDLESLRSHLSFGSQEE